MEERIAARIRVYPDQGLPCAVAHYIAADLGVEPLAVGQAADGIDVKGSMCQLGLFGYAAKGRPVARIRQPMENVPPALEQAIRSALVAGNAPCASLWQIGAQMGFSRLEMGNAVQALGIKVSPCQLGFF